MLGFMGIVGLLGEGETYIRGSGRGGHGVVGGRRCDVTAYADYLGLPPGMMRRNVTLHGQWLRRVHPKQSPPCAFQVPLFGT